MLYRIFRSILGTLLAVIILYTVPAYARNLSDAIRSDDWWEESDEMVLESDGTLRKNAEKQIKKAWKKLDEDNGRFRLALKVQTYIEKGFDASLAAQYADEALLKTRYGSLSLELDRTENSAGEQDPNDDQSGSYIDDTDAVSDLIACRSQADLGEIFARILETADGSSRMTRMLDEMGEVLQGETKETVLPYALQAEEAGWDGAYLLHLVWSPEQSPADTAASLSAMPDGPERSMMLKTAGMSFDDSDEILQYIYSCAQAGVAPSACYPDGAILPLDLSGLNTNHVSRDETEQTKILVLSRNEKTPRPDSLGFINIDIGLNTKTDNRPKSEDCTIRLETAWMDGIPAEHLPSSLEETNTILLADNQYYESGTMSVMTTTSVGGTESNSTTKDYRIYGTVQINSCFDWPSQSLLYSYSGHYTAPPEVPEEDKERTSYGFSMTPDVVMKYYKADMDPAWAADNMQGHLNSLSQNGWNTVNPSETGSFSDISEDNWNEIMNELYPAQTRSQGWLSEDQFSVSAKTDRIEVNWASFAGADVCDGYYMVCWQIADNSRFTWAVFSPGEAAGCSCGAMPGYRYRVGVWYGAETEPPQDGSMAYYTTEIEVPMTSDDPESIGLRAEEPFIQSRRGEQYEKIDGALMPSLIAEEGTEVQFSVPMEPVDGVGKDIRLTYCLVSPGGNIYYNWFDFTMRDVLTNYNLPTNVLFQQNIQDQGGGSPSPGEWTARASIDGTLVGKMMFTVDEQQ